MKRTGEMALGIIGIIFNVLLSLLGAFLAWAGNSDELQLFLNEEMANDPAINASPAEISTVLESMSAFGWVVVPAAVFGIIFGIIAIVNIKGNKNPKLAGWMYIVGAVVTGLVSVGFGFLPALLYLIAGIMSFVRKAPADHSV